APGARAAPHRPGGGHPPVAFRCRPVPPVRGRRAAAAARDPPALPRAAGAGRVRRDPPQPGPHRRDRSRDRWRLPTARGSSGDPRRCPGPRRHLRDRLPHRHHRSRLRASPAPAARGRAPRKARTIVSSVRHRSRSERRGETMDVRAHIEAHRDEFVATLSQWLAIPSISADPAHHDDVRRSAQWLADHFTQTGFPTVEIWETPGMPAVFAEWPAADPEAPTVLVYGHHDVQPVDPVDAWHTDPFTPT